MSNLVIVALPEETDRVWKVSSEQVPHLTLLFLGEADNNPHVTQIVQFVQHAVELSEHGQFYLDVDYRGKLGDAEADVLFFSKRSWNLKWIKQFRGQLLQNQQIRTAYDSTEQHTAPQDWVPHLTLGYPDTPARPLPDDGFEHPIYSVCFDRIAVWDTAFDGPEFRLEWPDRELEGDLAIAYSDQQKNALTHGGRLIAPPVTAAERGAEFLEHYGVKGMKWGERKTDIGNAANELVKGAFLGPLALASSSFRRNVPVDTKLRVAVFGGYALMSPKVRRDLTEASNKTATQKADSSWEKGVRDGSAFVAVNNKIADHFNAHISSINAKHPADFRSDTKNFDNPSTWGPKYKSYMKDVDQLSRDSIAHAGTELNLKNASGTREVEIVHNGPGSFSLKPRAVQHAAEDPTLDFEIKYTIDADGRVTGFTFPEEEDQVKHAVELGADFLAHYGVKGMKWGVRNTSRSTSKPSGLFNREPPKAVKPQATSKVPHGSLRKTKIETEGGENHPAHEDALTVAKSVATLKKSGTKALSNKELQDLTNRIRLEEQATQATRSAGSKWIRKFLGGQGNQAANQVVRTEVDSRIRSLHNK